MKFKLPSIHGAMQFCGAVFVSAFFASTAFATEETLAGTLTAPKKYTEESTVTLSNLTMTNSLSKQAGLHFLKDAELIIADDTINTITSANAAALFVTNGCTLTIKGGEKGNGRLICNGGVNGAAIGSFQYSSGSTYYVYDAGNIVIAGGVIEANAAEKAYGAAIGGGKGTLQKATSNVGDITITGGTITATVPSTATGCGIGGGYQYAKCGKILISGGTVTAIGGIDSAGIGAGGSYAKCTSITITGGKVTATGGPTAAGIGGYRNSPDITISGSEVCVVATKGSKANKIIGCGSGDASSAAITIDSSLTQTESDDGNTVTIVAAADPSLEITSATVLSVDPVKMRVSCTLTATESQMSAINTSIVMVRSASTLDALDDEEFSSDDIKIVDSSDESVTFDITRPIPEGESTLFLRFRVGE